MFERRVEGRGREQVKVWEGRRGEVRGQKRGEVKAKDLSKRRRGKERNKGRMWGVYAV